MPRAKLISGTCWDETWHPVVLPRDPSYYDAIADILDEKTPPDWMKVAASVVITGKGKRACSVGPRCGATTPADDECIHAVHDAIMALGAHCLAPRGMAWMGIWIDHDFEMGRMVARMMHGGRAGVDAAPKVGIPGIDPREPLMLHRALAA